MRKHIWLLICLGLSIPSTNLHAITTWGRIKSMLTWGTIAGIVSYVATGKDGEHCMWPLNQDRSIKNKAKGRLLFGGAAGITVSAATLFISSYYTASYRLKWARTQRFTVQDKLLFKCSLTSENLQQISIATGAESTPLPLVTLHLELVKLDKLLSDIKVNLDTALKDVGEFSGLSYDIKELQKTIQNDLYRIRESEYTVKNNDSKKWEAQWNAHKSAELKEKQIEAMNRPQLHYHGGLYHHTFR